SLDADSAQMFPYGGQPDLLALSPVNFSHLCTATSTNLGSISQAKHRRLSCSAAMICDPLPENGSKQMSPRVGCLRIGRPKISTGFCVGCSLPTMRFLPSQLIAQTDVILWSPSCGGWLPLSQPIMHGSC